MRDSQAFLDAYRILNVDRTNDAHDELKAGAAHHPSKVSQYLMDAARLEVALQLLLGTLAQIEARGRIVEVDASALGFLHDKMSQESQKTQEPLKGATEIKSTFYYFPTPIELKGVPFQVHALFAGRSTDPEIIDSLKSKSPSAVRAVLDEEKLKDPYQVAVEALSADGEVEFFFGKEGGEWKGANGAPCQWGKCTKKRELCGQCLKLLTYLSSLIELLILAENGHFQQTRTESRSRIVQKERPGAKALMRAEQTYRSISVNIAERVEYEKSEPAAGGHTFWTTLHDPSEIDPNKRVQGAYYRLKGTPKEKYVIPQKARSYPRLRDGARVKRLHSSK